MKISDRRIDGGKSFEWGKPPDDYAKYRDIYPPIFHEKLAEKGLCISGQRVLDLGTGTDVLPRITNAGRYRPPKKVIYSKKDKYYEVIYG